MSLHFPGSQLHSPNPLTHIHTLPLVCSPAFNSYFQSQAFYKTLFLFHSPSGFSSEGKFWTSIWMLLALGLWSFFTSSFLWWPFLFLNCQENIDLTAILGSISRETKERERWERQRRKRRRRRRKGRKERRKEGKRKKKTNLKHKSVTVFPFSTAGGNHNGFICLFCFFWEAESSRGAQQVPFWVGTQEKPAENEGF